MQFIIPLLAAIVLAVLALIQGNSQAHSAGTVNGIGNDLANAQALAGNIQSSWGVNSDFSSVTDAVVIANKLVPPGFNTSTGSIVSGSGAVVTVQPDPSSSAELDEVWSNVSQANCSRFATGLSDVVSVQVNGGDALVPPVDAGTVGADCTSGSNNITFVFQAQG